MNLQTRTRFLVIALLISLQTVTLISILGTTSRQTEALLRSHAEEVMGHVAEVVVDNTRRFLEPAERAVQLSQALIADGLIEPHNDLDLETYFLDQLQANASLAGMYLGRLDGSFVFVKRENSGFRTKFIRLDEAGRSVEIIFRDAHLNELNRFLDPDDTYDPRVRPWFQAAEASKAFVWTEPYLFSTAQRPGTTAALKASSSGGENIGVLGVDIEITGLSAFLDDIPIGKNGAALIQNAQGVVVAYPNISRMLAQRGGNILLNIEDIASPAVQALSAASGLSPVPFKEFSAADKPHYAFVKPFTIGEMTWNVSVQAPAEDFTGTLKTRYRRSLWETLAIFTIITVLAIPLGLGVTVPFVSLHRRATTDALTGLYNRSEFLSKARALVQKTKGTKGDIAVVMLDLDGFKPINDRYGHAVGDEVLKSVAERLRHAVRDGDVVGRFGGDEFALALRGISVHNAQEAAERVRMSIIREPVKSSAGRHSVGATAGVTTVRAGLSLSLLLAEADEALLRGKASKKGRTYLATSATTSQRPSDLLASHFG